MTGIGVSSDESLSSVTRKLGKCLYSNLTSPVYKSRICDTAETTHVTTCMSPQHKTQRKQVSQY
jgi:hypothetical protein